VPPEKPPEAPAARRAGRGALDLGFGVALPGADAIGSAMSGYTVASYADVWASGFAFEAVGEFGGGKVRPYAKLGLASFAGQLYENPSNPGDAWVASDGTVMSILGGAKISFGVAYAKAALGLAMMPEMSRIDNFTGTTHVILDPSSPFTLAVGCGAELRIGKLKAYADLELDFVGAPATQTEDAYLQWPQFEPAPTTVTTLTGGIGLSF